MSRRPRSCFVNRGRRAPRVQRRLWLSRCVVWATQGVILGVLDPHDVNVRAAAIADRLAGTTSAFLAEARVSDLMLRKAALSALSQWRGDPASGQSALAVVFAAEWIQQLGELATHLEGPVEKAVEGSRVPWWR